MTSSPNSVGVATIDVNTTSDVTATYRVKSVGGFVLWSVHNLTNVNVTVCLTDFTPVAGAEELVEDDIRAVLAESLCSRVLKPGHQGPIVGFFTGVPGSIYSYTITVNGSAATDPQLEI
jgi:hypothetical protein